MKRRKWLLIIVLIVFVINISFFVLVHSSFLDKNVQSIISAYLEQNMEATVNFGSFTFNDKQLKISELSLVKQNEYEVFIDQLYVEYNLAQLLLSRFKILRAIKQIKIFEPQLLLNLEPPETKKNTKLTIPDITRYFKKLAVFNGKLEINYRSDELTVKKEFIDLDLTVTNSGKSKIELSAIGALQDSIYAESYIKDSEIKKVKLNVSDFALDSLYLKQLENIAVKLDLQLNYIPDSLDFGGNLEDIQLLYNDLELQSKTISFNGNSDNIDLQFEDLNVDNINILAEASIYNYLSDQRAVNARISSYGVPLSRYIPSVQGALDVSTEISGQLQNPDLEIKASSTMISAFGQQLDDIVVIGKMQNKKLSWQLQNAIWNNNLMHGNGSFIAGGDMHFDLQIPNFVYEQSGFKVNCDLESSINYREKLNVNMKSNNVNITSDQFSFQNYNLMANLNDQDFSAKIQSSNQDIIINSKGRIDTLQAETNIQLRRIELSQYLSNSSLPIISGNIDLNFKQNNLQLSSMISAYDRDFGKLSGRLSTIAAFNFTKQTSFLKMNTYNAKYNYEPFKIDLQAEGSFDSLNVTNFNINNDVKAKAWLNLKPDLQYDLQVNAEKVKLRNFAKYFTNYYFYDELKGKTSFILKANNLNSGNIQGNIAVHDFAIGNMQKFDGFITLSGNQENLQMQNSYLCCENEKLLDISSQITLQPEIQINLEGKLNEIELDSLFIDNDLSGVISGAFQYNLTENENKLNCQLQANNLKQNDLVIDKAELNITQLDSLLIINDFSASKTGIFHLNSSGMIGYNLLNTTIHPDSNTVDINFEGDLLALLDANSSDLNDGSSDCQFAWKVGMQESGIFLKEGNFDLSKGTISIKDQPAPIEKLNIELKVEENRLSIDKFKFEMGAGKAYISNEITNSEDDFRLGTLNLGHLLIRTNNSGLQIYIPGYNPQNSYINVVVTGRNTDFLEVNGPFDDLLIYGNLIFSNGYLVYPPNTENLLKLFNRMTEEKKQHSEPVVLPLSLDLRLKLGQNVRYVTYPIDIQLKEEGYIWLQYYDGEFHFPDGLFISEAGSIDMFGTNLTLDYMQVELNQFRDGVSINGLFYKRTSDGTMITLELINDESGTSNLGNLRFELNSDNPADLTTDILAKLRYNRSMDEISPAQKQSLLQDEVIQIAGLGLESAVLDPLISPVENFIRKLIRLDYFHLQTDLIQNLFATYSSEDKSELTVNEEQTEVDRLTSELFLNNLSVSAGKYLDRKIFFDYNIRFEKEDDITTKTYIGVYQDFTLRYDLPWKLRLSYQFSLLPFDEENEHQIGLERTFRF